MFELHTTDVGRAIISQVLPLIHPLRKNCGEEHAGLLIAGLRPFLLAMSPVARLADGQDTTKTRNRVLGMLFLGLDAHTSYGAFSRVVLYYSRNLLCIDGVFFGFTKKKKKAPSTTHPSTSNRGQGTLRRRPE